MDRWHDDQVIDVLVEMHTIFSRVTSRILFKTDAAAQAATAVVKFIEEFTRGVYRRMIVPLKLLKQAAHAG